MTSDNNIVACQYEWPEDVRIALRSSAIWARMSMTDLSALLIRIGCDVIEKKRMERHGYVKIEDMIKEIQGVISNHPEFKTIQETLSSFISI